MFDIVFEENKYFAIKNYNGKIIYTYPSNIKIEDMNRLKQYSYNLKYRVDNSKELSIDLLRINPNKPFLKTSYSIDRDHITFEILEQDDFTRGNFFMHIFTGEEVYESIKIESVACPDISYNNIYLRGTSTDRDRVKIFKRISPDQARIMAKILDDLNTKSIQQIFLDSLSGRYKNL